MLQTSRRSFLIGSLGLLCAPAIVRASSLMPVKTWCEPIFPIFVPVARRPNSPIEWREAGEHIPFASAVRLGDDGRIYLCRHPDQRLFGVSVNSAMPPPGEVIQASWDILLRVATGP